MFYNDKKVRPILFYIFLGAFCASWVLGTNSINLSFLAGSDVLSGAVGNRLNYVNSDEITNLSESRKENSLFVGTRQYFVYAINIYVFLVVLFLNKLLKRLNGDRKIEYTNLFSLVLFFYSFAFIAISFPSGLRFMNIAHLFLILLIVKFYTIYKKKDIRYLILLALPVFSFQITFVNGMLPLMILTPTFWYGNVFWNVIEGIDFLL